MEKSKFSPNSFTFSIIALLFLLVVIFIIVLIVNHNKLVKYKELGDKIYFTEPFVELNLLYKGWYTDENGFPYLNEKEVEAIALYCAYAEHYKKGIVSKD